MTRHTGLPLPATLAFDHLTPETVEAAQICGEAAGAADATRRADPAVAAGTARTARRTAREDGVPARAAVPAGCSSAALAAGSTGGACSGADDGRGTGVAAVAAGLP
ncbi:hypothetical protein H7H53_17655, partial [Mycobacterium lacus]|nr:hypothetical protein [Mycobacterium lacus]